MAPPTFVQESRLGRVIFQIRGGLLHISSSGFNGSPVEYRVDLRCLEPNYKPLAVRLTFQLLVSGVFLVLCSLALWGIYHQTVIPHEALAYFSHWPLYGIVISLVLAVQASSRVECFRFSDHWGKPAFVIVRERRQAAECEAFILTLVSHIELAQSDLPAQERETVLRQLAHENPPLPQTDLGVPFWKLSLVFGVLAAGIPWVPDLSYYFAGFEFFLVFALCVGGATCCAVSYQQKEPSRHWSLLGLILSLIPPYFY